MEGLNSAFIMFAWCRRCKPNSFPICSMISGSWIPIMLIQETLDLCFDSKHSFIVASLFSIMSFSSYSNNSIFVWSTFFSPTRISSPGLSPIVSAIVVLSDFFLFMILENREKWFSPISSVNFDTAEVFPTTPIITNPAIIEKIMLTVNGRRSPAIAAW